MRSEKGDGRRGREKEGEATLALGGKDEWARCPSLQPQIGIADRVIETHAIPCLGVCIEVWRLGRAAGVCQYVV